MIGQGFVWFNIFLALGFVLIFLWGRRGFMRPSRLNLRVGMNRFATDRSVTRKDYRTRDYSRFTRSTESFSEGFSSASKSLNVLFMYNGHSWDAHEVLGVPAGAKIEQVKTAFETSLSKAQPDSKEFLQAAFDAIRKSS